MDSTETMLTLGWWSRQTMVAGARACYRLLVTNEQRLIYADFATAEPSAFFFARGARALELRILIETGTVISSDPAVPQRAWTPDELSPSDRRGITATVARALRLLSRQGKNIFLVEFADEAEPMLMVFARGARASELHAAALTCGLISPGLAAA
jgi:hypothetical protein